MNELSIAPALLRMPSRRRGAAALQLGVSAAIHLTGLTAVVLALGATRPPNAAISRPASAVPSVVTLPRVVFLAPRGPSGGGGGGGDHDPNPIRHATAPGHDAATLRTRRRPVTAGATEHAPPVDALPAMVLEARSLAAGDSVQAGLPVGGVSFGTSLGPGVGGGVGSGRGTGLGSGEGPGVGPGSGGGIGGGVYRVGSGVTAPRLLAQTTPRYTPDALQRKIQGTVSLDAVVGRDGRATNIRIVRSLDGGLDQEAIRSLLEWRFSPGTLAGSPVDVEVVVVMDFRIH
ncbi:MAG TPA: energy transducer TonB [Vicinamibacterales bacterium]|nr:energy transducer TonB [Vicinamibacterales bacterium]